MIILLDLHLCSIRADGNAVAGRKIAIRREHRFKTVADMDAFISRLQRMHFPTKIIEPSYKVRK